MPGKTGIPNYASEKTFEKLHIFRIDKFCLIAESLPLALCVEVMSLFTLPYGIDDRLPAVRISAIPCGQGLRIG